MKKGFTLVELLVVMAIMALFGTLLLTIFTNTLKGSNKSQVIGVIKQNGQSVLETMDKTIRNADKVVCDSVDKKSLVVVKNGVYTRYSFIAPAPVSSPIVNGFIKQDNPTIQKISDGSRDETDPELVGRICADNDSTVNPISPVVLTDINTQSGVSVNCHVDDCINNPVFKREKSAGFMDQVTINFNVKPGVEAPASVTGQIDAVNFRTTIQLR